MVYFVRGQPIWNPNQTFNGFMSARGYSGRKLATVFSAGVDPKPSYEDAFYGD